MKKIIPVVIILIGIGVMFYPKLKELYIDYKSTQISKSIENGDYKPIDVPAIMTNDTIPDTNIVAQKSSKRSKADPVGIIKISKIGIKYPILNGSSLNILNVAVGHIDDTKLPGEAGNCVLAAHRSFTYGRFFNRLDEVVIGDTIDITTKDDNFTYTVFEKKRVLPSDTSVLKSKKDTNYITLITCDPMRNPTHRLILLGKLN